MDLASIQWRGRVPYDDALLEMQTRREAVIAGDDASACVLLLEHDPVITLGRHGSEQHLRVSREVLAQKGIDLHNINRGGDITYHGPGQLVIYPILRIGIRVSAFLAALANALGDATRCYGVDHAEWKRDPVGLWHGDSKLAACGIHVSRGVCMHGFAYNVSTPADAWSLIVPCGLQKTPMTSLARLLDGAKVPTVAEFAESLKKPLATRLQNFEFGNAVPPSRDE